MRTYFFGFWVSGFCGAIFFSVRSKASGDSSMPSLRAVSLNRSDCSAGVMRSVFGAGFMSGV